MPEPKKRVAVVGAGIAGLTCAWELQKAGFEVVVYEKNAAVGGRMSSRVKDGFIFDLGADHLCDLYDHIKAYCREFGIGWEQMRFLKYGIYKRGRILGMRDAIGRIAKWRLALTYVSARDAADFFDLSHLAVHDTHNAYDFMKPRAGRDVADYLVDAFSSTYQFHRATEISVGALFGIMRSIEKDKDRWDLHRTAGGMQALPEAFAARLPVRLNAAVREVEGGEAVRVRVGDGDESFDAAVLAATAPATLALYANPTADQREVLAAARFAATISVAFRVDRARLPDVAVVWVPFVESRAVSGYVNEAMKGEELVRGGESLLCVWLHEDFAKEIMDLPDAEIFGRVKAELLRVCPWFDAAEQLADHDLQKWPEAMPKFAHGHLARVKTFLEDGQGAQNVFLAGDWLNSPWTEGAVRNGQRVAAQVSARLSRPEADPPSAEAAPR